MSWLSSFVNHNRDWAGNALKNVSPLAFLIPGVGPGVAAGLAGAGSALGRGIQHGANIGNIAKQGIQGAGEAYAGGQGLSALKSAYGGASAFAPSSAPTTGLQLGGQSMGVGPMTGGSGPGGSFVSGANTIGGDGFLDNLRGAAKGVAGWTNEHANAVSGALQGVGQIGTLNSENALRNAQAQATQAQSAETSAATAERARRAQALLPLLQAFSGQGPYAQNQFQFSPNPYYRPVGGG